MPDFEKDVAKRMNRDFLYQIVTKLDAVFFTRAMQMIEEAVPKKEFTNKLEAIKIKPELLKILQQSSLGNRGKVFKGSCRVLQSLLTTTKKRKLKDLSANKTEELKFVLLQRSLDQMSTVSFR